MMQWKPQGSSLYIHTSWFLLLKESVGVSWLFLSFWFGSCPVSLLHSITVFVSRSVPLSAVLSTQRPHAASGSPLNLHIRETSCCRHCNDCGIAAHLFICFQVDSPRFTSLIFPSICSSQDLLPPICGFPISAMQPGGSFEEWKLWLWELICLHVKA